MPALDCVDCEHDEAEIARWRVQGGRMPRKTCLIDHRPICKVEGCNNRHEYRVSGYCDPCYAEYRKTKKTSNKPRLNPLDVLKVPGQWVIK